MVGACRCMGTCMERGVADERADYCVMLEPVRYWLVGVWKVLVVEYCTCSYHVIGGDNGGLPATRQSTTLP